MLTSTQETQLEGLLSRICHNRQKTSTSAFQYGQKLCNLLLGLFSGPLKVNCFQLILAVPGYHVIKTCLMWRLVTEMLIFSILCVNGNIWLKMPGKQHMKG